MNNTPSIRVEPLVINVSRPVSNPKVVGLSDGNVLVAYADRIGSSNRFQVRGRIIAPDGNPIGGEIRFVFSRSIDDREFDITALANNHVAVVVEVNKGDDDIEIESGLFRVSASGATRVDSTAHRIRVSAGTRYSIRPSPTMMVPTIASTMP